MFPDANYLPCYNSRLGSTIFEFGMDLALMHLVFVFGTDDRV